MAIDQLVLLNSGYRTKRPHGSNRDIKPEKILFVVGHAVITDFGVARALTNASDERHTETGLALGAPAYMSPEQANAGPSVDGRQRRLLLGCGPLRTYDIAGQYTVVGAVAQSLEWLARAYHDRHPRLPHVVADSFLECK